MNKPKHIPVLPIVGSFLGIVVLMEIFPAKGAVQEQSKTKVIMTLESSSVDIIPLKGEQIPGFKNPFNNDIFKFEYSAGNRLTASQSTEFKITSKVNYLIVYDVVLNDHDCPTIAVDDNIAADKNGVVYYKAVCGMDSVKNITIHTNQGVYFYRGIQMKTVKV